MSNLTLVFNHQQKLINGMGTSVRTLGTFKFYFHFGGKEYTVNLKVVLGPTPLMFPHKDLDYMKLHYRTFHKIIESPEEGYTERIKMRSYLLFMVFGSTASYQRRSPETFIATLVIPQLKNMCVLSIVQKLRASMMKQENN